MLPQRREVFEHFNTKARVQILGVVTDVTRPQTHQLVVFIEMEKPQEGYKAIRLPYFLGTVGRTHVPRYIKIQDQFGKRVDSSYMEEEAKKLPEESKQLW